MIRLALLAACTAACSVELGPETEWIPIEEITGALAPSSGAAPSGAQAPAAPGALRVVTFNVEYGEDPAGIAAAIRSVPAIANAGLYVIQEIEAYPAEGAPRAASLAAGLGVGWTYLPARIKGDGTHGLAILTPFPIENVAVMPLREASRGGHPRIAVAADVVIGAQSIRVVTVHLETKLNITDRILQLRPAVIDLPPAVIVAGDFNTSPFLWEDGAVPVLPDAQIVDTDQAPMLDDYMTRLGFATPAADVGPTDHKYGIEARLDAIYTRGLAITPAQVERSVTGSDHWPVWLDAAAP